MSDTDHQRAPGAKPELTPSERIFVRISIWQTVLSVLGVFVAAVALYAALTESEAVRRQTAAAVWPYVQLSIDDYETAESAEFRLSLTNAGVGPAHVRAMRVSIHGEPQPDWASAVRAAGADGEQPFSQAFAQNRVIRPGERVDIFSTADRGAVRALRAAVAEGAGAVEFCYCSIFDQCWIADSRSPEAERESRPQCPDYGADQFERGN